MYRVAALRPGQILWLGMVLLVDDDVDLRDAIREELESEGYAVVTAGDGHQALEELRVHAKVSLILVDLKMPTMDGRQLIAALRREGIETPVVVLSGSAEAQRRWPRRRSITGAIDVLEKPFRVEALLRIVAQHAHARR